MGKYLWTGQQQSRYKGTVVARRFRRDDGNHRGQRAEQPGQGSSNMFQYLILWHLVTSCDILWHFSFFDWLHVFYVSAHCSLRSLRSLWCRGWYRFGDPFFDAWWARLHKGTQCDTVWHTLPIFAPDFRISPRPDEARWQTAHRNLLHLSIWSYLLKVSHVTFLRISSFRKSEMVIIWWSYNVLHVCRLCRNDRSWIMSRPSDAFCVRMDLSSVLSDNCDFCNGMPICSYVFASRLQRNMRNMFVLFVFGENWSRCPHSTLDILLIYFQHDKTMSPEKHETRLLGPFESFQVFKAFRFRCFSPPPIS